MKKKTALMIIDMQNYYLSAESSYYKYFNHLQPGCLDYILKRCEKTVIPNIRKLADFFREAELPVIYLRLCSREENRNDLHRFFKETYTRGKHLGFDNIYPLWNDPMAEVTDRLKPETGDFIIDKTTFSAFSSSDIHKQLSQLNIEKIIFTGLATSQCVETTARDASDYGYDVVQIIDAQADYDEFSHNSSLYSSGGVCGGVMFNTDEYIRLNS